MHKDLSCLQQNMQFMNSDFWDFIIVLFSTDEANVLGESKIDELMIHLIRMLLSESNVKLEFRCKS